MLDKTLHRFMPPFNRRRFTYRYFVILLLASSFDSPPFKPRCRDTLSTG